MSVSFLPRAMLLAFLSIVALSFIGPVRADDAKPFLHPLFTDNMVLQRGMADPVWGWTTPGKVVTVSLNGRKARAIAGADGKWMAKIGPFKAGGPYTLDVSGPQTVTLKNVLIGDVWICSGQSNMEFGIGNVNNAPAEIAAANHPSIRLFKVSDTTAISPRETVPVNAAEGHWQVCSPQTIVMGGWNGFSAVGYFFARDLQQSQHVPIGLIESNWGGTEAEAWTSARALKTLPDFQPAVAALQQSVENEKNGGTHASALAAWYARHDPGSTGGLGWADPAQDISAWKTMSLPQFFQDAGDPELANINGVVWFRRTFDLPAGAAGKDAILHLLADDNDTTWINGTQVGATEGYNTPRAYKIAAGLLKPTGNVIAVRVLDTGGKGGIYGAPAGLNLEFPGGALSLTGPWSYKLGTALPANDPVPALQSGNPNVVTVLYNGMIAPLIPFGVKGALWYQGETNAGRGKQYQTLLPTLIKDWRSRFGVGPFPFLIVQLAGWQPGGDAYAELREAQFLTAQTVPNTGIATAIDIGNQTDIHPKDKQDVGARLALVAEARVYGQNVEYSGPVFKSMTIKGGAARISFDHVSGGLMIKNGPTAAGFTVAGADGNFVPADARIDGDSVVVSASQVSSPVAVRYAWGGFPECTLYNKAGLPAFPFRTDRPVTLPAPAPPANAGADLALGKPVVASDVNRSGWANGLTDGSWLSDDQHCWASGQSPDFPKTVTVDLQQAARVGLVEVGVPPFGSTKTVQLSVSADGKAFTDVGSYVFRLQTEEKHLFAFPAAAAQFIRLTYPDHYEAEVGYPNRYVFTTECAVYAPAK